MRVRVIGLGTPFGDDAAGLVCAERLRLRPLPAGVDVVCCEQPLDLVQWLAEVERAVLVDAVCSGSEPGSLQWPDPDALRRGAELSTHALGVADALELAAALGAVPAEFEIVGIEVRAADCRPAALEHGRAHGAGDDTVTLSAAAERGVERAIVYVLERLARWERAA